MTRALDRHLFAIAGVVAMPLSCLVMFAAMLALG